MGNLALKALVAQDATPDEFEAIAREAVDKRIANPIPWVCATLAGRRRDAAAIALAPPVAIGQAATVPSREADASRDYIAEQRRHAEAARASTAGRDRAMETIRARRAAGSTA